MHWTIVRVEALSGEAYTSMRDHNRSAKLGCGGGGLGDTNEPCKVVTNTTDWTKSMAAWRI